MTLEIISDGTTRKDMAKKLSLYKDTAVKEYWVVDPKGKSIYVYRFTDSNLEKLRIFNGEIDKTAESFIFEGLCIELDLVFR